MLQESTAMNRENIELKSVIKDKSYSDEVYT